MRFLDCRAEGIPLLRSYIFGGNRIPELYFVENWTLKPELETVLNFSLSRNLFVIFLLVEPPNPEPSFNGSDPPTWVISTVKYFPGRYSSCRFVMENVGEKLHLPIFLAIDQGVTVNWLAFLAVTSFCKGKHLKKQTCRELAGVNFCCRFSISLNFNIFPWDCKRNFTYLRRFIEKKFQIFITTFRCWLYSFVWHANIITFQ